MTEERGGQKALLLVDSWQCPGIDAKRSTSGAQNLICRVFLVKEVTGSSWKLRKRPHVTSRIPPPHFYSQRLSPLSHSAEVGQR